MSRRNRGQHTQRRSQRNRNVSQTERTKRSVIGAQGVLPGAARPLRRAGFPLLLAGCFGAALALAFVRLLAPHFGYFQDAESNTLLLLLSNLTLYATFFLTWLYAGRASDLAFSTVRPRHFLWLIPALLAYLAVGVLLAIALLLAFPGRAIGPSPLSALYHQEQSWPPSRWIIGFLSIGVAPFCEELFWRGQVFKRLAGRYPLWKAVSASSLFFAAAHLNPVDLIPLAVSGAGCALLYWRSKSLWPAIALHCLCNLFATLLLFARF